jgi:hypothetical protein
LGEYDNFPENVVLDEVEARHGLEQSNNEACKNKRLEWVNTMGTNIGNTTI